MPRHSSNIVDIVNFVVLFCYTSLTICFKMKFLQFCIFFTLFVIIALVKTPVSAEACLTSGPCDIYLKKKPLCCPNYVCIGVNMYKYRCVAKSSTTEMPFDWD